MVTYRILYFSQKRGFEAHSGDSRRQNVPGSERSWQGENASTLKVLVLNYDTRKEVHFSSADKSTAAATRRRKAIPP